MVMPTIEETLVNDTMSVNECELYSLLHIIGSCYMDDFGIHRRYCAVMQVVMKS